MTIRAIWCSVLFGVAALLMTLAAPPSVVLDPLTHEATTSRLKWHSSRPDLRYTVETRNSLASGEWTPFPGISWPITNVSVVLPNDPALEAAFFRIHARPIPADRGSLQSVNLVGSFPAAQIQLLLGLQGITSVKPRNGVRYYKLVYETVDAHGFKTPASGALVIPDGAAGPFPLVSYQHGTITEREDVPSRLNNEGFLGVILGSLGYVATLPDYVGLGDSPGFHPYHHATSEATATIDLLRAARSWCDTNGVILNQKLFLTGYSQGGHATLAAMREIETRHTNEFQLTAVVGGAGAYDLTGVTTAELLQDKPVPNPYYLAYILSAYVDVYGLADSLGELLIAPYSTNVPPLFDGTHDSASLNAALPAIAVHALRPDYLAEFRNRPDHPLRVALRENSLIDWTPQAPLRLYHCAADRDVPPANARVALESFQARGATQVGRFDPLPTADHGGCVEPTLLATLAWFETLR